jgi:rubredoxin
MRVCPIYVYDDDDDDDNDDDDAGAFMLFESLSTNQWMCRSCRLALMSCYAKEEDSSHNIPTLSTKQQQQHQHTAIPPDDYSTAVLFTLFYLNFNTAVGNMSLKLFSKLSTFRVVYFRSW